MTDLTTAAADFTVRDFTVTDSGVHLAVCRDSRGWVVRGVDNIDPPIVLDLRMPDSELMGVVKDLCAFVAHYRRDIDRAAATLNIAVENVRALHGYDRDLPTVDTTSTEVAADSRA